MSGLCGIWCPEPGERRLSFIVQAGLDAIAHRGRDGFSLYPDNKVALGHCLLDTGCNGMFIDEHGFAITFDGRLDNRNALANALRAKGVELTHFDQMADKALLLLAYRQFGTSLPERLRGDFAIAIWDPELESLFLCRDHFGVRPLFYRRNGGEFYFASEIKGLRAMAKGQPFTVRDQAIRGFVAGQLDAAEPARTFYDEVFRLLPGHCARISADGMKIRRYWTLDPGHAVRGGHTGSAFRHLLAQAIDRRLRTTAHVGAMLSGGLDSSAIVSMIGACATRASPSSVDVFSMTFPDGPTPDEARYIQAVLDAHGLKGTMMPGRTTAFQRLDDIIREQDHPPPAPNTCTFRQFLDDIATSGTVRVVLHGHGGDEVVSNGTGLFAELAEAGRWLKLWRALGESSDVLGPRRPHFQRLVVRKGLRAWRERATRRLMPGRLLGRDPNRFATDGRRRSAEQALHLRDLTAPLFFHALEVTDHEAAAAGLEIRMPFLDVDLVSFCVTVAAEEKWADGLPRSLLRRSLKGILPPLVAERKDKFDFADRLRESILQDHAPLVHEVLHVKGGWLAPYADLDGLRADWREMQQGEGLDGSAIMRVWRAVILSRWLQMESAGRTARAQPELAAAK